MRFKHDDKKPFKCKECDFRSARVYGLSVHVIQKHTDEKPWACDQCDFRTKMKQSLKVHKQIVHEKAKLFKCELCPYETTTNQQLKDHMNTHTGARPYKCDKCDYTGMILKKMELQFILLIQIVIRKISFFKSKLQILLGCAF